jgi:acetoin reductase-like protein
MASISLTKRILPSLSTHLRHPPRKLTWTRAFTATASRDKSVIVTGSSRGIGKAIALRLADDGYDVCINDISANQAGIDSTVSAIKSKGRNATGFAADVSKLSEVDGLVRHSVKELGNLDTMIANAGIAQVKALLDLTEEDMKRMFEVNVFGVHNCYTSAARQMIKQKTPGKLIGCSSIVGFKPFPLLSHYSASKWAVRGKYSQFLINSVRLKRRCPGLTQAMAMEVAEHNITCNAYAPGIVGTAMWDLIDEKLGEKAGMKKGEMMSLKVKDLTALGRASTPEDLQGLLSFLSSKDSDFMTGQTIVCDGGIIYT